jgi:hypothetical protein
MAKLIMRLTCAFGLLALAGVSDASTAATPAQDPPVIPPGSAAVPAVERMAGCRSRSYQCYGLRKGCRVVRDRYLHDYWIRCPPPRWGAPAPRYYW